MSLQIRRGTNADRISITPEVGELIYTTDTNALYVGNGIIPGGILVSAGNSIYGNTEVLALLASGNVTLINANTVGALSLSVVGVSSAGYVRTNNYQYANGQPVSFTGTYSNANVQTFLPTYTGNLVSLTGNVTTTANITGGYFIGNGSQLTGLPTQYANSNVSSFLQGNFSSNIIPAGNGVQSLGNATRQFKDLWVSNSTIYIDTIPLTSVGNTLTWKGNALPTLQGPQGNLVLGNGNISANNLTLTKNISIGGNGIVSGNLFVSGNLTYTNVNDVNVSNAIIYLAKNNSFTDVLDSGLVTLYNPGSGNTYTGLVRNHLTDTWNLFDNLQTFPDNPIDWANTVPGNLELGTLTATTILGNVSQTTGLSNVAYTGNYISLTDAPTNVSFFTNDANYITTATANVISVNGQTGVVDLVIPTTTSNLINDSGFITTANANVISVNGQTGVVVIPAYGNSNVAEYLTTYNGNLSANNFVVSGTSNINEQYVGNLFITGNADLSGQLIANLIYANVYRGDGGELSNISGSNISGNIAVNNISVTNVANVTGNIQTSGFFLGNGAYLTGLPAQYGNSNVADYLSSGNITTNIITGANVNAANLNVTQDAFITGNLTIGANLNVVNVNEYVGATGNVSFTGNLIPATNGNIYTLGLPGIPWPGVYANYFYGDGSNLTGLPSSYTDANVFTYLGSNSNVNLVTTGNVTANAISTTGTSGNIQGVDNYVGNNIIVTGNVNSQTVTATGNISATYFIGNGSLLTGIAGGSSNTIQNGNSNVSVATANGNITITVAGSQSWNFGTDGVLTLADGNSTIQSIANSSQDPLNPNVSTMVLTPDSNYNSQVLVLDPTAPGHLHIRTNTLGNIDEPTANLFLGGELSSFEVGYYTGTAPNLFVHSGGNTWTFANDGLLTLPSGSTQIGSILGADVIFANNAPFGVATQGNGTTFLNWSDDISNTTSLSAIYLNGPFGNTGDIIIRTGNVLTPNIWNFGANGEFTTTGNIVASYVYGDNLEGNVIVAATANISGNINTANLNITQDAFITGNLTVGANLNVLNVNEYVGATGNVSFTGNLIPATNGNTYTLGLPSIPWSNVYANYFVGNGSQLTGIVSSYGNSNVSTFLGSYGSNTITTTGNITSGNILISGAANIVGNVTVSGTGAIYIPNLPAFRVYGSGFTTNLSNTVNGTGRLDINNFNVEYNQSGGLNAIAGIFTAPLSGLYSVHLVARTSSFNNAASQIAVLKNGNVTQCFWENSANCTVGHFGVSTVSRLTVGDTLELKVLLGTINFDANDNWSVAYLG